MNWPSLFCLSNSIIEIFNHIYNKNILEITNPNINTKAIKTIDGNAHYLSEVLKMHKIKV